MLGAKGESDIKEVFGTCCEYVRPSNEFEKRCTPKLNPVETYEEHGSLVALYLPTTTLTWYSNEDMDMVTEKGNLTGLFQRERPMHRDASVENATRNDTLGPSSFSAPPLNISILEANRDIFQRRMEHIQENRASLESKKYYYMLTYSDLYLVNDSSRVNRSIDLDDIIAQLIQFILSINDQLQKMQRANQIGNGNATCAHCDLQPAQSLNSADWSGIDCDNGCPDAFQNSSQCASELFRRILRKRCSSTCRVALKRQHSITIHEGKEIYVDTSEGAVIEIDIYHHDSTNEHWKLKVNGGNSIRFNDEAYRNSTYEEVNSMYDGFEYCTLVYGEGRNCTAGMEVVFAMQMASGWHKTSQKTKHFTWRTW